MGGHMLARKIMRTGYFWLTMETDCCQFVQRCPECQIHGDLIHVPPRSLHALTSPWPFSVWGIDIIGKISPKSSNGHEFILVAIDYFTKWVEAGLICEIDIRWSCQAEVDALVQRHGIRHHRSSAYRPQTNGAVGAANKNIKRILRKMVETSRDWSEKLPFALWVTGLLFAPLQEPHPTHWCTARFDQLNLLDEKRLRAADHVRAYQMKMARAFRKRVKPRPLHIGDLVLRVIRGLIRDPRGKFRTQLERTLFHQGVDSRWRCMADGSRWKPVLRADQCDQLKSIILVFAFDSITLISPLPFSYISPFIPSLTLHVHGSRASLYILHFIHEGMSFDHWVSSRQPLLGQVFEIWSPFRYCHASSSGRCLSDGHIYVRMRFTDHEGVACLSLFARCIDDLSSSDFSTCYILDATLGHIPHFARFLLSDIVVVLGRSYVECLDSTSSFQWVHIRTFMHPMVLFSGHQGRSGTSDAILGIFPSLAMEAIVLSHVRRSFHHSAEIYCIRSLTIIPKLFIDMSSQWSVVRDL
ncbi:hypothetical protein CK203_054383 [Vitis vinifera]|uniref:Integrase catalytic domain-containing protein n=1 Tax=Vitis vinifera TaxID=29760 RepID=A0A438GG76_VITVI|nr:hypothetical protein CK203_054383 [Vitis vinifera]